MRGLLFAFVILMYLFDYTICWWFWESTKDIVLGERCIESWLPADIIGLKRDLENRVFGQPFLVNSLIPLLERHMSRSNYSPKKALVLSFHGSPGVGKTYVSQIIASHLFKKGHESKYYKFISMSDAYDKMTEDYLRNLITDTIVECDRAMFVFDEIEKMPDGVIGVVKSFLDFHPLVGNVDYRKSIFIFISNIGLEKINELSYSLWKQGVDRNNFNLAEFEKALFEPTFNEKGGLKRTSIVKNYLIDLYLPFLPLKRDHVIKCIEREAKLLSYSLEKTQTQKILDNLIFLPPNEQVYVSSGCKNIHSQIIRYGTSYNTHEEL